MKIKSVKSSNPYKSVIQTNNDIINAHIEELSVETKELRGLFAGEAGSTFIIILPVIQ